MNVAAQIGVLWEKLKGAASCSFISICMYTCFESLCGPIVRFAARSEETDWLHLEYPCKCLLLRQARAIKDLTCGCTGCSASIAKRFQNSLSTLKLILILYLTLPPFRS